MKKQLFISLLIIFSLRVYSAGPTCPPFSPCWCMQNPTHPRCTQTGVPINGGIEWLALGGLGIYYYKKVRILKNKS